MSKQNETIHDDCDIDCDNDYVSSDEEIIIECEQIIDNDIKSLEINYEEKSDKKQNKKKTIIKKINIEENEEILSFNEPCTNCEINKELLYIVRNLSDKLNNIESELKELKKMIKKKDNSTIPPINKKNIMEWLNNYVVPTITFNEFVENIIVNMGHFEFLLEYKLPDIIQKIIQTNIVKNNNIIYPLYASIEKCGKVYVFTEDETWEIITIEYLSKFVKKIENKLSQHCIEWKSRYSGKNNFNSELQERCQNAILKLYNISYTQDTMMNRVRHDLCEQLKIICK
jgi:hypothetical protein